MMRKLLRGVESSSLYEGLLMPADGVAEGADLPLSEAGVPQTRAHELTSPANWIKATRPQSNTTDPVASGKPVDFIEILSALNLCWHRASPLHDVT